MARTRVGTAVAILDAENKGFTRGLKQSETALKNARRETEKVQRQLRELEQRTRQSNRRFGEMGRLLGRGGVATVGLAAFAAVATRAATAFKSFAEGVADTATILQQESQAFGITVTNLDLLRRTFLESGVSAQQVSVGLRQLSTALGEAGRGSAEYVRLFDNLGVSARNAEGGLKTVQDILPEIADGFGELSQAEQVFTAQRLFGRGGTGFLAALQDGADGFRELGDEIKRQGQLSATAVQANLGISASLNSLSALIDRVSQQVLGRFGREISATIGNFGILFGDVVRGIADWVAANGGLRESLSGLAGTARRFGQYFVLGFGSNVLAKYVEAIFRLGKGVKLTAESLLELAGSIRKTAGPLGRFTRFLGKWGLIFTVAAYAVELAVKALVPELTEAEAAIQKLNNRLIDVESRPVGVVKVLEEMSSVADDAVKQFGDTSDKLAEVNEQIAIMERLSEIPPAWQQHYEALKAQREQLQAEVGLYDGFLRRLTDSREKLLLGADRADLAEVEALLEERLELERKITEENRKQREEAAELARLEREAADAATRARQGDAAKALLDQLEAGRLATEAGQELQRVTGIEADKLSRVLSTGQRLQQIKAFFNEAREAAGDAYEGVRGNLGNLLRDTEAVGRKIAEAFGFSGQHDLSNPVIRQASVDLVGFQRLMDKLNKRTEDGLDRINARVRYRVALEKALTGRAEALPTLTSAGRDNFKEGRDRLIEDSERQQKLLEALAKSELDSLDASGRKLEDQLRRAQELAQSIGQSLGFGIQQALLQANSLSDVLSGIGRSLAGILIQFGLGSIPGGVGRFLSGRGIGPPDGRQSGGPVQRGRPYLVGEGGPELFVPDLSGSIIPNGGFGGGLVINFQPSIQTTDAGVRELLAAEMPGYGRQIAELTYQAVQRDNRRRKLRGQ